MLSQIYRILNWGDKVRLQDIVDDLKFVTVENKQKYTCVGCGRLALCHYIAECNHLYCGHCHGNINEKQCLVEGCMQVVSKITQDINLEEEIANLKVFCPFSKYGCLEEIALKDYMEHERKCPLSTRNLLPKLYKKEPTVELKLDIDDLKKTIGDLTDKNRLLEHQLMEFKSHQQLLISEIQKEQKNFKKMVALQMEKINIKNNSKRGKLKTSIEDLRSTNRLLEEELSSFKGQLSSLHTKIEIDHKQMVEALPVQVKNMAIENEEKFSKLQEDIDGMMAKCDDNLKTTFKDVTHGLEIRVEEKTTEMQVLLKEMDLKIGTISGAGDDTQCAEYTWEIGGFGRLISRWSGETTAVRSNTFALRGVGIQNKTELIPCGKDFCIFCSFQQLPNFDPEQPLFFKQSICILDQSETGTKVNNYRINLPSFKDKADQDGRYLFDRKTNFFVPVRLFEEKNSPYVKHDAVIIKFLIEPMSISYNAYFSKYGRLLWKIDRYKEKRMKGVAGINMVLYSDYFYSSEAGYRMILEARFHHSTVIFGLRFVKGKYDDFLPTYFPHRTILRILDQSKPRDGNHLLRTCDSEEARYDKFIELSHEDIEKDSFLKDECIVIDVTVASKP